MSDLVEKRDELRAKIEASDRRNAKRSLGDDAREAASAAGEFIKRHPGVAMGGAVATGLAIGLMTKPGRRVARNAAKGVATGVKKGADGVKSASVSGAKKRSSQVMSLLGDAIIAYGIKVIDSALDTAQRGQDTIEDLSDAGTAKARELKRDAGYAVGSAGDTTRAISRRATRKAGRAVRDLKDRVAR
ncbi:MAG: hypothetical protein AAGL68_01370 [Pseudomonadota bacterium]